MTRSAYALSIGVVLLAYPLAVYIAADYVSPKTLMAVLLVILAVRLPLAMMRGESRRSHWWLAASAALLSAACAVLLIPDLSLSAVRLYPAVIDFCFFAAFFGSLFTAMPLVERIARTMEGGELPPDAVIYTLHVTWLWCGVLLANTLIALYTAFYTSFGIWSLYNGLLSYLLIGGVFAGEYLVRRRRRAWADA